MCVKYEESVFNCSNDTERVHGSWFTMPDDACSFHTSVLRPAS